MNSNQSTESTNDGQYQVVALKYRPQSFEELIGQGHIAKALSNAIDKNRVGHAYLFTGARGVGKTSSARIFAKCLNCETGPTKKPCGVCDICEAVSAGEDVDVLEIDGASNRGIDEIRQLRSNAAVRPSRSKYKIYIIDEVHMLTMQAFNALLKTLEEPPLHVKFIFCTTDPQKIPITVLSRCQRFDFSPVQTDEIAKALRAIATSEGVTADEQALALLARRANGSMRDSQSLLEQLFSFCGNQISIDEVHQLLGTADMSRISAIATAMTNADPTETLNLIHRGMIEGVDAGQMADQLLGYFRDMMAVRVGCGPDTLLNCTAVDMEPLGALAEILGLETILTIVQLLDSAVVRMQSSLHARILLESAAVRICNLEKLDSISDLINSLGKPGTGKPTVATSRPRQRVEMQQVNVSTTPSGLKKNDLANPPTASQARQPSEALGPDSDADANQSLAQHASALGSRAQPEPTATPTATGEIAEANHDSPAKHPAAGDFASTSVRPDVEEPVLQPATEPTTPSPLAVEAANRVSNSEAKSSSKITNESIKDSYDQMLEEMGDMTADMASDYKSLVMKSPTHLVVTLSDTINRDLCSKPDRKQKFEIALEAITGNKIKIDFLAAKRTPQSAAPAPKLTRVQQIRQLQEVDFVAQTIDLFDAEITGYHELPPTKKS